MTGQSMDKTQADWEKLLAGIEANKEDLAHVESFSAALSAQLADLRAELARRSALQAEVLRSSRVIKESLHAGNELASRINSYLRAQYGRSGEKLVEFGLKPAWKGGRGSLETCHHR